MLTPAEIHTRHSYQKPTWEAAQKHDDINNTLEAVALKFEDMLPESREKSIVHTKLEEVRFWANAAIARNHDKL